jgi:ABC-type Fe3+-siderophore transport system permease subunit
MLVAIQEVTMLKIAAPVWMMIGTTLAGIAVMIVLSVPSLAAHDRQYIPYAALVGFIVAIPIAYVVAGRMRNAFRT